MAPDPPSIRLPVFIGKQSICLKAQADNDPEQELPFVDVMAIGSFEPKLTTFMLEVFAVAA